MRFKRPERETRFNFISLQLSAAFWILQIKASNWLSQANNRLPPNELELSI